MVLVNVNDIFGKDIEIGFNNVMKKFFVDVYSIFIVDCLKLDVVKVVVDVGKFVL